MRPAPPAWSRDLFWEWLSVTEWRWPPPLQYGDVGFLKAQFGATQTLPYGQRCYVTHSASRSAASRACLLCLLLLKKLDPNGSCGPHLRSRGIQWAVNCLRCILKGYALKFWFRLFEIISTQQRWIVSLLFRLSITLSSVREHMIINFVLLLPWLSFLLISFHTDWLFWSRLIKAWSLCIRIKSIQSLTTFK